MAMLLSTTVRTNNPTKFDIINEKYCRSKLKLRVKLVNLMLATRLEFEMYRMLSHGYGEILSKICKSYVGYVSMPLNYICSRCIVVNLRIYIMTCSACSGVAQRRICRMSRNCKCYDKGKVVPVLDKLSTTPKNIGGVNVQTQVFLTSALVEGEWSALCPGLFTSGERALSTYKLGDWVGPRTRLVDMEK
jgi:hypothetical protein